MKKIVFLLMIIVLFSASCSTILQTNGNSTEKCDSIENKMNTDIGISTGNGTGETEAEEKSINDKSMLVFNQPSLGKVYSDFKYDRDDSMCISFSVGNHAPEKEIVFAGVKYQTKFEMAIDYYQWDYSVESYTQGNVTFQLWEDEVLAAGFYNSSYAPIIPAGSPDSEIKDILNDNFPGEIDFDRFSGCDMKREQEDDPEGWARYTWAQRVGNIETDNRIVVVVDNRTHRLSEIFLDYKLGREYYCVSTDKVNVDRSGEIEDVLKKIYPEGVFRSYVIDSCLLTSINGDPMVHYCVRPTIFDIELGGEVKGSSLDFLFSAK
ncbi:MAG: hypothetical protein KBT31_05445 [Firmicutes bacterium]|nr:hypothetical protein [Candidatus Colimorpha enterica]